MLQKIPTCILRFFCCCGILHLPVSEPSLSHLFAICFSNDYGFYLSAHRLKSIQFEFLIVHVDIHPPLILAIGGIY